MRALSNRDSVVLEWLRRHPESTCVNVSIGIREENPCPACSGTGERDGVRCRGCYGWGTVLFSYGDAYQSLKRLMKRGLVERQLAVDQWGDETRTWLWSAVPVAVAEDPLEQLFALPSATKEA